MSRAQAKPQGLTRYFTGKPCKHGHTAERMVSSGACLVCHAARRAQWDADNRDKASATRKAWSKRNPDRARAIRRKYEVENAERVAASKRAWRERNPEKIKAKNDRWLSNNRDRLRELNSEWYKGNRDKVIARDMRRRAGMQAASVTWDFELTSFVINEAAELSAIREGLTGFKWHIDHMIPIKCRKASGLHVWSNLQLIPASMNAKKHNRFVLTEPGEWIRFA